MLLEEINLAKVEQVVMNIPKGSSLRPKGFTIDFFRSCWPIISLDVWELVEDSQRFSNVLPALNSTCWAFAPMIDKA